MALGTRRHGSAAADVEPPVPAPLAVDEVGFSVIPHTHWDREWYLPFEVFRMRLVRTVDEILDALDADDRLAHFTLDGQAAIVDDYLELRPERGDDLARLAQSGRLALGPAYVLPDEFLIGAETHVRNLLLGREVVRRLGVEPMAVGYQPDAFGHIAQMPQILRGFGLDGFVFWRGMGDEVDRVGPIFRWTAPDGSWVHAIRQLDGYGGGSQLGRWIERGVSVHDDPARWPEAAAHRFVRFLREHSPAIRRGQLREVTLASGGDHMPIQSDLPEMLDAARTTHAGSDIRIDRYDAYLDRVRDSLDDMAQVDGEMLGAREAFILRGVNSTRMDLKQRHAAVERDLLVAETLATLALMGRSRPYPRAELWHAWRELLRNSPHDSVTGCSVDAVHANMHDRYDRAAQIAGRVRSESIAGLGGETEPWSDQPARSDRFAIVEPLGLARTVAVRLALPPSLAGRRHLVAERDGDLLPVQAVEDASDPAALVVLPLTPFETTSLVLRSGKSPAVSQPAAAIDDHTIANGRFRVRLADGSFEVEDRTTGLVHPRIGWLEDVGDAGDEYSFRALGEDAGWSSLGRPASVAIVETGPLVATLEATYEAELRVGLDPDLDRRSAETVRVPITVRARVIAGVDRVEFEIAVDNRARDHRLRFRVEDSLPILRVRAEGQFAVLQRTPGARSDGLGWAETPESTDHTTGFVAAGRLALVGRGLPEYEAFRRHDGGIDLALTLLRCVGQLGRDLAGRTGGAGPAIPTPDAQCQGRRTFELALLPAEDVTDAELVDASMDYRLGAEVGRAGEASPAPLCITGDPVAFSALKAAEDGDGVIIRVWNPANEPAAIGIDAPGWTVERCRLDEAPLDAGDATDMTVAPAQIGSFRLRRTG